MKIKFLSSFFCLGIMASCQSPVIEGNTNDKDTTAVEYTQVQHPEWSDNSSIYEVNIRQHTAEGTFKAFENDLPRLKEMGVEILWVMPIQPIGEKKRKGGLGSYYSIKDYTATNPEFGSMADFKSLVNAAHELGFKVILDWVANHSAWDNKWMEDHMDWYTKNDSGEVVAPVADWSDVADLNYDNQDMREAMIQAMEFWIKEADVDGYRCDVASMVPMDFWNETRRRLDLLKPVFMLAEAEGPDFHQFAFDMTYGWEFHHLMNEVAKGNEAPEIFDTYKEKVDTLYPKDAYRMFFTTNHDENSWNGTVFERMGKNHLNFFVLAATFPGGMPLIYSGQEAGLNKRLAFFDKDTVSWENSSFKYFYESVIKLKSTHPALVNGEKEGSFERVDLGNPNTYAFRRKAAHSDEELIVLLNFSGEDIEVPEGTLPSKYTVFMAGKGIRVSPDSLKAMVKANDFLVLKVGENK